MNHPTHHAFLNPQYLDHAKNKDPRPEALPAFDRDVDRLTGRASSSLYSPTQEGSTSRISARDQARLCKMLRKRVTVLWPKGNLVPSTADIDKETSEILRGAPSSSAIDTINIVNQPLMFNERDHLQGVLPGRKDFELLRTANHASATPPSYQEACRNLGLDPENPALRVGRRGNFLLIFWYAINNLLTTKKGEVIIHPYEVYCRFQVGEEEGLPHLYYLLPNLFQYNIIPTPF